MAVAELAIRRNGQRSISLDPGPERTFVALRDYGLRDYVPVWSSKRLREPLAIDYAAYDPDIPSGGGLPAHLPDPDRDHRRRRLARARDHDRQGRGLDGAVDARWQRSPALETSAGDHERRIVDDGESSSASTGSTATWIANDTHSGHTFYLHNGLLSYGFMIAHVVSAADLLALYEAGASGGALGAGYVWTSDGMGGASWELQTIEVSY
jgi:hypothetical protein